ncbi:patatin-like phospholipase family protein [Shewanella xiamenensis]|uniref:patatin-like phospholipase family protein n=1 Tax=Shewanella xiamenensis TaxID=332186 RepID=UPI0024A75DA1|nr:patatin-like phospholipase family protein [Shewanella xiamenensis]MDI5834837.1 patatin-like phospholipase family protein [Shewanella xiamenensis]MDI5838777.1 patatin-like phospholipase family protein [Shewanella xiamenensis]MDI5842986.1 patatin-like phospholipase family protein [Shewanella xiamenensis]MDI5846769.1 patatin-like phospholipase family protein [Shewanella xiamenensis]MDI5850889.1 patatin-like phospholipase family protein [Shewanella xiamenensis]
MMRRILATLFLCVLLTPLYAAERPKVGLVLSGGGAKGAAHVGVLKILEEHHIPVDYIAGTSIGAYVAGMYSLGYSASEVEAIMMGVDWDSGYSDTIPRSVLSYRDKQLRDRYNIPLNIGYTEGEVRAPSGVLRGQTMSQLLRQSTDLVQQFGDFDALAIPYRAVATDLETSLPVIISHGSIIKAMQASATVPGALQPTQIDGKLLVDGGIANNMPVDVVKAMGADIIIAVDIGSPLVKKDKLDSTIAVLDQLSNFLTNASTEKQKQLLTDKDVLIRPAIDALSTTDFTIMPLALTLGKEAANGQLNKLQSMSLSAEEYAAYVEAKRAKGKLLMANAAHPIKEVIFDNQSKVSINLLKETLNLEPGQAVTKDELNDALKRIYALNKFERVDAEFVEGEEGRVLTVTTRAKSWGPNYFQLGFNWEDDFSSDSAISFDMAYTMTDLTFNGGEWRNEVKLGFEKLFATEFYQPLDRDQKFYSRARYQYDIHNWDIYDNNNRALIFNKKTHTIEMGIGYNYVPQGVIELGLVAEKGVIINDAWLVKDFDFNSYGAYLRVGYDSLDSISFPTSGNRITLNVYVRNENFDDVVDNNDTDYSVQIEADWKGALSVGNHSFVGKASLATINNDSSNSLHLSDLGGFLNLSGYHKDSLNGDHKLFGAFVYQYDLGRDALGMRDYPLYLGLSLEAGNVWYERSEVSLSDLIYASSLYIGTDTSMGPAALGFGITDMGDKSLYLFVGKAF